MILINSLLSVWSIVSIAAGSIVTLGAIAFLIWFWARTPDNLSKWYCIPVTIVVIAIVVLLWVAVGCLMLK